MIFADKRPNFILGIKGFQHKERVEFRDDSLKALQPLFELLSLIQNMSGLNIAGYRLLSADVSLHNCKSDEVMKWWCT